ncbi:GNAT family N-acetyltransferase [Ferrimonas balearica]|uniref:GNAT family N-acetyltransferase n=1 Tax=Ferrimonas balearica TaxID=44012 RepID=UPI001C5A7906|nr:GNAT family N-acetyltransferase [Ferrimonas balearica]MBW3166524.1 GNAT family N-acetyltransferase [Ferrimonas balearica]
MSDALRAEFVSDLSAVDPAEWDRLLGHHLFTRYHYLAALEQSHCVGEASGWLPHHLLVYRGTILVAAMPLYIKLHSYGEYLFDWSWARAYEQRGLDYYPKLVSAIPFTAITGPRLGIDKAQAPTDIHALVGHCLTQRAESLDASGVQLLFPDGNELKQWPLPDWYRRRDIRFQWHHRGEANFSEFLGRFKSRKRKMVNKERQRLADTGISFETLSGHDLTDAHWHAFIQCYQTTYLKRSGHPGYLSPTFFRLLAQHFAEHVVLMVARQQGTIIACALYLKEGDTLYGRYWGALQAVEGLHFELCYYRGIEYCLQQGLSRFDPGVQGEHKLARGFEPVFSYGTGMIRHPDFAPAIAHFCREEWLAVGQAEEQARQALPFREGE